MPCTRRAFLRTAAVGAAVVGSSGYFGRGGGPSHGPVFDAHLHVPTLEGELHQWHRVMPHMDDVVRSLDCVGVARGIITNARRLKANVPRRFIEGNREVIQYARRHPGRFLPAVVINSNFPAESVREIEACHEEHGIVWIGEMANDLPNPRHASDAEGFDRVVQKAMALNMVLHVHTTPLELEMLVGRYPDARLVFPHLGRSPQEIRARVQAVAAHPRAYFEISGAGPDRVGMIEYAVQIIGEDRVLFGSDPTINDPGEVIARVRNACLTDQQKEKILHLNVERLLREVGAGLS